MRTTPPPLTQSLKKPPGATTQLAEPEPNPTGKATRPSVYITQPTHGAAARPSKPQAPAATRLATPNADQCLHQPREGRGRNRQTPPKKRGGRRDRHTAAKPRTYSTGAGQTPQPDSTEGGT